MSCCINMKTMWYWLNGKIHNSSRYVGYICNCIVNIRMLSCSKYVLWIGRSISQAKKAIFWHKFLIWGRKRKRFQKPVAIKSRKIIHSLLIDFWKKSHQNNKAEYSFDLFRAWWAVFAAQSKFKESEFSLSIYGVTKIQLRDQVNRRI